MILIKQLGERRLWSGVLPLFLLLVAGANLAVHTWQATWKRQREENLLISASQQSATAGPARWDRSVGENLEQYLPQIPDASKSPLVILAGMSQMYAINDPKPDDEIIVEHLDDALAPKGVRAFGLAAPNMNNEEGLLLLLSTVGSPKSRPAIFVYGVCFDKFRNIDLRPGMQRLLASRPDLAAAYRATALRYRDRYPKAAEKMLASLGAALQVPDRSRPTFEDRLREQTGRVLPLVAARKEVNGTVLMKLFELRNWVFHITPQSKRPILQSRYDLNQQFLEMIAEVAREHGVQPVFYVIPLNPLARNPYIPEQYAAFKKRLTALCAERQIPFANLEGAVPSQYWGEFMGGPDFKHFRGPGHQLTAQALLKTFGPLFEKGGSR